MSLEPIIAFFLVRYYKRCLKDFTPASPLTKGLTVSMYVIAVLFVADILLHTKNISKWFWDVLLLALIILPFKQPVLNRAKRVLWAISPILLLLFIEDILKAVGTQFYYTLKPYVDFAYVAAFTWAVTMLLRSNKQNKALETERKKTQEEEEKRKFIATQKDKLEILVAERTAEITNQKEELQQMLNELKATQTQLVQSEKMASLGELTAGIAHEIQNPLNFVNNFSEVNVELIEELKEAISNGKFDEVKTIADDIKDNEQKIGHHGKRADSIVKGMLQHSRTNTGQKELTDINALADEYLRLSYHGLRAKNKQFNATIKTDFDITIGKINIVPQDMGRVLLNLFNNSFYSVNKKYLLVSSNPVKAEPSSSVENYQPTVSVTTKKITGKTGVHCIEIKVCDNGLGIEQKSLDKIFQPFFTTKPSGQGTGLGLSLSYDIVTKIHKGTLEVNTKENEFAEFIIILPV